MNKYIFFLLFLIFTPLASSSYAEATKIFTLKDGATFQGHLSSVEDGIYTVESPTLGHIKLKEADVLTITSATTPSTGTSTPYRPQPAATTSSAQQMQAMQASITSNPAIMADIQAMASNPRLLEILTNPALLTAISQGPEALQGNPDAEKLLNDPQMQALIQKIQASQAQP